MAVNKKEKRKEEKNTDWRVPDVWMGVWVCGCVGVWVCGCVGVWVCGCVGVWVCGCVGVWVCGCVGVWMGVQPCGHADADGCKQKRKKKKKHLLGCFERADGRAEADNCKEKKKERKGKKKGKLTGLGVWTCEHFKQCSNIAKQDQTVRTRFEHVEMNV